MNAIDEMACATPGCDNRGKPGLNIVGYGSFATKSGRRRRYRCTVCRGTLSTNTGTAYSRLRCTRREFDQVASLRVEGVSISATARVTGHSRNTVARWLERHRTRAAHALSALSASGVKVHLAITKTYSRRRYASVMRRSKIALSPWGYGEVCLRDFEAMLSGAVLIKPDMSHVTTEPPIYRANETYLPCQRDFSDLDDLVDRVVSQWKQFRELRERAYELITTLRTSRNVAALLAGLIFKGLALHDSGSTHGEAIP